MKTDMAAYGVSELTPNEASATSGGFYWPVVAAIGSAVGVGILLGGIVAELISRRKH